MAAVTDIAGRFRLEAPLGEGGEGVVWRARALDGGPPVAIKFLTGVEGLDRNAEAAVLAEARAAASLDHPHIVQMFDYGRAPAGLPGIPPGAPWLAMELATGGSLRDNAALLDWRALRLVLLQVLDALGALHARGLLHRDIKPGNILLVGGLDQPDSRIADFGLASWRAGGGTGTHRPVEAVGTPRYMAPEQLRGDWRAFGPWTDLFAIGCLAWTFVTGTPPVAGSDPDALLAARLQPLPSFRPALDAPAEVSGWLRGLLVADPRGRTRFAADARAALAALPDHGDGPRMLRGASLAVDLTQPTTPAQPLRAPAVTVPLRASAARPAPPAPMPSFDAISGERGRPGARRGLLAGLLRLPLVGRQEEQAMLWSALAGAAMTRRPTARSLVGTAGVGKSRLAEWLCEAAHEQGSAEVIRVVHGRDLGSEDGILAALSRQLGCRGLDAAAAAVRLGRELPLLDSTDREQLAALFSHHGFVQAGGRAARYQLLQRVLREIARDRPLVLWCDDAGRSGDTLGLIESLLDDARSLAVLVVLTVRSDEARRSAEAESLQRIAAHPRGRALPIEVLPPAAARALIQAMIPVDDELAQRIAHSSGGRPILVEQTVRDWIIRGVTATAPSRAALPAGPDMVWSRRLAGLLEDHGPEAWIALELAAALGETVDGAEWAAACVEAGVRAGRGLVDDLVRRGLARPLGPRLGSRDETFSVSSASPGWVFAHSLLREHLRLIALHEGRWAARARACASVLLQRGNPEDVARVGRLQAEAGQFGAGAASLVRAAARLVAIGEFAEAESILLEAEVVMEAGGIHGPASIEARVLRAHALCSVGDLAGAEAAALGALEDAADQGARVLRACARRELGRVAWYRGQLDRAAERLRRARDEARRFDEPYLLARIEVDLANALLGLGEFDEAEAAILHAIGEFRGANDPEGLARALLCGGELRRQQRRWAAGITMMERGLRALDGLPIHPLRARLLHNLGEIHRSAGDYERAEALYREAEVWFERVGDRSAVWFARMNRGLNDVLRGERARARAVFEAVAGLDGRQGLRLIQAVSHVALVELDVRASDRAGATRHLDALEEILAETGYVDVDIAQIARRTRREVGDWPEVARRLDAIATEQRARLG